MRLRFGFFLRSRRHQAIILRSVDLSSMRSCHIHTRNSDDISLQNVYNVCSDITHFNRQPHLPQSHVIMLKLGRNYTEMSKISVYKCIYKCIYDVYLDITRFKWPMYFIGAQFNTFSFISSHHVCKIFALMLTCYPGIDMINIGT